MTTSRLALVSLSCLLAMSLLVGCSNPVKPEDTEVSKGSTSHAGAQDPANVSLTGTIKGFGGDSPVFKATDAAKFSVSVQDETGTAIPGTTATKPDKQGNFSWRPIPLGAYVVSVTLPDKSKYKGIVRTDTNSNNFVGPGSTLAWAWAKSQIDTQLLFLQDIPTNDYGQFAVKIDEILADSGDPLAEGQDGQLEQFTAITTADAYLKDAVAKIETKLTGQASINLDKIPTYVTAKEYAAKKKRLEL